DYVLIVTRNAVVNPALHQDLHQLDEIGIHVSLALECDTGRLFVRAFTEPNSNAFSEQFFHISFRTLQICLDDCSHAVPKSGHAMQFVNEVQGALSVGRSLHIDTHKTRRIHRSSLRDQTTDNLPSERFVYI